MKNFFILILCFNLTTICLGQNWEIMNIHSYNHYKNSNTKKYSNSIMIDSFKQEGADSIFFLNLICPNYRPGFEIVYYYINRPQFLNKQIRKTDSAYYFYLPDTFQIKTNVAVGDTWHFNDSNLATVIFSDTQSILNTLDSIRVIACGTADTIIVSKNHGIIRFDDFRGTQSYFLIGVQNDPNAFQLPTFKDLYNYEIGDEICYSSIYRPVEPLVRVNHKIRILEKYSYPDKIIYLVKKFSLSCIPGPPNGEIVCSSTISIDSMIYTEHTYPGLLPNKALAPLPYIGGCYGVTILNYDVDSSYIKIKAQVGLIWPPNDSLTYYISGYDDPVQTLEIDNKFGYTKSGQRDNFGETEEFLTGFHGSREYGDSCLSDSAYIHAGEIPLLQFNISIYPTLVQTTVQIHSEIEQFKLEIFDAYGQLIFNTDVKNNFNYSLDFSRYHAGLYVIQMITSSGYRIKQKVIKQ